MALPFQVRVTRESPPDAVKLVGGDGIVSGADWISSKAVRVAEPADAVIVADTSAGTWVVDTVKVADELPAGTVTLAGTPAFTLLLERLTTNPPAGAAAESVTVPVEETPPTTVVGDRESPVRITD